METDEIVNALQDVESAVREVEKAVKEKGNNWWVRFLESTIARSLLLRLGKNIVTTTAATGAETGQAKAASSSVPRHSCVPNLLTST